MSRGKLIFLLIVLFAWFISDVGKVVPLVPVSSIHCNPLLQANYPGTRIRHSPPCQGNRYGNGKTGIGPWTGSVRHWEYTGMREERGTVSGLYAVSSGDGREGRNLQPVSWGCVVVQEILYQLRGGVVVQEWQKKGR